MAIDDVDAAFRTRMRVLALKGGAVTKRRFGSDPRYYRSIGRLGGNASVAARKARIAAEVEGARPGEAPIVEAFAPLAEVVPVQPRAHVGLKEVLADLERDDPRASDPSNRRRPLADLQAEADFTRWVTRIRDEDAGDEESWDPWNER